MSSRQVRLGLIALVFASPAMAHHRQTPPIVALTTAGDTSLPRVSSPSNKTIAVAIETGSGDKIVSISPWKDRQQPDLQTLIADTGDHANPAVSVTGRSVTFDSGDDLLGLGVPGRQVYAAYKAAVALLSNDPTGTSVNPSIDTTGQLVAFESTGDLAATGNPGARQIFLTQPAGTMRQLSQGVGTSRNPVVSAKKGLVAFDSTSDPTDGHDTGIAQIWVGNVFGGAAVPITKGLGPSMNPAISNDGRIVTFESTADLGNFVGPVDTGVPQIYVYDTKTQTYARVTNDPLGCTMPSAFKSQGDWRIAFMCNGAPDFYMLRADQRYQVQTGGGVTQRLVTELGIHFVVVSTTADLLNGGVTQGRQVYLVNLFKRPAVPVPGPPASWFPTRGIPPF